MHGTEPSGQIAPQFSDLWNQFGQHATKLPTGQAVKVETFTPDIAEKKIDDLYSQLEDGMLDRPTAKKDILQLHTWSLSPASDLSFLGRMRLQTLMISLDGKTPLLSAKIVAFFSSLTSLLIGLKKSSLSEYSSTEIQKHLETWRQSLSSLDKRSDTQAFLVPFKTLLVEIEGISLSLGSDEPDQKSLSSIMKNIRTAMKDIFPNADIP